MFGNWEKMNKNYKYWMIQGIANDMYSATPINDYDRFYFDIYPLNSILDIWYYIKQFNYNNKGSYISNNFTLILAPSFENQKLFKGEGTWWFLNSRRTMFLGSYQEFLDHLETNCGVSKSDILWSRGVKNIPKLASEPFKP